MKKLLPGVLVLVLCAAGARAQAPATQPQAAPVTLDFPADGVELKTLADIVTKRLGIPILYDESINAKRVIIRVPKDVPESSLLGILQSALRMKQMALVDAEQPGWKQIVPAQNLAAVARAAVPGQPVEPGAAITQLFNLKNADPTRVAEGIRPFLTQPGGNVQVVPGQRVLIVSDYPTAVKRMEQIVGMLDSETSPTEVRFARLQNADAKEVAAAVTSLIANRDQAQFGGAGASGVFLDADDRLNQIAIIAPPARMNEVVSIIEGMDRAIDHETKVYRLKLLAPERLDKLIKNQLGATAAKRYQATADRDGQALVVTANAEVHKRIDAVLKELDTPAAETHSPMKFYKLKNTRAVDVLATISGLQGESNGEAIQGDAEIGGEAGGAIELGREIRDPAGSVTPPQTLTPPAKNPAVGQPFPPRAARNDASTLTGAPPPTSDPRMMGRTGRVGMAGGFATEISAPAGIASVHTRDATIAADANTNSIIVIAPPDVQQMYADLIDKLDQRRPQVQIECTIVTIDTTDGYSIGVDISELGGFGDSDLLTFSSFGIAQVNVETGALTPVAAPGGTLALLSPDIADVVIRAVATNTRARLVSAPQLLVNDNGTGTLRSEAKAPFAQILDSSGGQSITSFGEYASAGTIITVEPHISEDDYLQLRYSIELSSFTGQAADNLPPPAQTNNIDSMVTIPDGHTIVVGGLSLKNLQESVRGLPVIRYIPILNWLFSIRTKNTTDSTLFVFIRPVILRDDKFEDLKHLSERSGEQAGLQSSYPKSEPIPLR